jgi:hypothetical protein
MPPAPTNRTRLLLTSRVRAVPSDCLAPVIGIETDDRCVIVADAMMAVAWRMQVCLKL